MESTNNLQSLHTCWSPQFSLNIAGGKLKNEIVEEGVSRSRDSTTQKKDRGVVSGGYGMSMIHDGAGHHQYQYWASDDAESCSLSNDDFKDKPFLNSPHLYSTTTTTTLAGFGAPNISNINININMQSSSLSLFMHPHIHTSSIHSSTYPSQLANGVVETKRSNALMESKPSQSQTASKKIRPQSRSSCPPLKVRKEKLGDRIAALQQLVAPFGKTDTASVLMEAIGYIKFLQNQVETLSVPYMKSSSRNQNNRVMQAGSDKDSAGETAKRDLRSRGLCLVPLSCMSYITGDHAPPAMWNQPNFGGPT